MAADALTVANVPCRFCQAFRHPIVGDSNFLFVELRGSSTPTRPDFVLFKRTFDHNPPPGIPLSLRHTETLIMAPPIVLKLTNRSPKKPIKKLPTTLEVPHDASVEEIKVLIARETGCDDFNRIGLFDPTTNKTLKDRRALISEEAGVLSKKELLVKDLGTHLAPLRHLSSSRPG